MPDLVARTIAEVFTSCANCASGFPVDPTVYRLTDCTTGERHYTTGTLSPGIADEVGRVVKVAENPGQCWQSVAVAVLPTSHELEAFTISESSVDCATCIDPAPCVYPAGNPPAGFANTYTVDFTWNDNYPTTPPGMIDGSYSATVTWNGTNGWWVGEVFFSNLPYAGSFDVILYLNPVHVAGSTCCVWRVYVMQNSYNPPLSRGHAVRFTGSTSPIGDYEPTGNSANLISQEVLNGSCEIITPDGVISNVSVSA